jgi:hypothetical protein
MIREIREFYELEGHLVRCQLASGERGLRHARVGVSFRLADKVIQLVR